MAPSTCTDPLEHVLLNVLKANAATDPYRLALSAAGVTTIDDLLDLSKSDLQALSYKDDEGVSHHLPIGKINTILSICSWFQTQERSTLSFPFAPGSRHRNPLRMLSSSL